VAAHQLGLLPHLPDPPVSVFDSDRIFELKVAHPWGIPDGLLGLGSYGATLTLVLLTRRDEKWNGLQSLKRKADASAASFNLCRQIVFFPQTLLLVHRNCGLYGGHGNVQETLRPHVVKSLPIDLVCNLTEPAVTVESPHKLTIGCTRMIVGLPALS
jgi:hypothetical protein